MESEIVVGDREQLAAAWIERIEGEAAATIAARGRFVLALPGGSVAEAFVPPLIRARIDWRQVELLWLDERAVPPEDPASNFGLAWRSGLSELPLAPERVHRLRAEAPLALAGAADTAETAERELRELLGSSPRIDFALVGFGPDGHVASLFPDHPALRERERWIVAVDDAPKPPPARLTWTLALFRRVDLAVIAGFGAEKAAVVRAAAEDPESDLPLARVARAAARRLFLLDPPAASALAPGAAGRVDDSRGSIRKG